MAVKSLMQILETNRNSKHLKVYLIVNKQLFESIPLPPSIQHLNISSDHKFTSLEGVPRKS